MNKPGQDKAAVPLTIFQSNSIFNETLYVLVHKIFGRPRRNVTLLWRVQNVVVIGWSYFKPARSKFWSNFKFDRNTLSGTGARGICTQCDCVATSKQSSHAYTLYVNNISLLVLGLGWGLLSQFPPFCYCSNFSSLSKHTLAVKYRVYIWQVSPQLSCGDTCQIWMWFEESNMYFCKIKHFAYGEINERSFSNPHPRTQISREKYVNIILAAALSLCITRHHQPWYWQYSLTCLPDISAQWGLNVKSLHVIF